MTTSVTPYTCSYRSHTVFVVVLRSIHLLLLALSRLPALSPTGYGPRSLHRRTFRRLSQFLDLRKLTVHRPILQPFFPAFPSDFLVRFCGRFSRTSIQLQQDSIFVLSLLFFFFFFMPASRQNPIALVLTGIQPFSAPIQPPENFSRHCSPHFSTFPYTCHTPTYYTPQIQHIYSLPSPFFFRFNFQHYSSLVYCIIS